MHASRKPTNRLFLKISDEADALPLERLPPVGDENSHYEFCKNQFEVKPPIGAAGSMLASRLAFRINDFEEIASGRVFPYCLFRLRRDPELWRRPEVAFVSLNRWPIERRLPSIDPWDVIPDLVVEVVSPTNFAEEIPTKIREYFEAGVRRAWVVYLHESIVYEYDSPRSIRVLGINDTLDGGLVIPGFQLPLADLFDGPEESESPRPIETPEGQPE